MDRFQTLTAAAAEAVRSHGLRWYDERRPPASARAIAECEKALGIELPESYKRFLACNDGVILGIGRSPSVRYVLKLLGTSELVRETEAAKTSALDGFPGESFTGLIVFADIMDGDLCLFDLSQARGRDVPVLVGEHEDDPDGWRLAKIANDFDIWYRNVLSFVAEYREHNEFRYWWVDEWSPQT